MNDNNDFREIIDEDDARRTEIDMNRIHACLAAIENQLKAIYEITGGRG